MILELVSFMGTSVGGTLLGSLDSIIQNRHDNKLETKKHDHEQRLADKGALSEYYKGINQIQPDGNYTPMAYVIAFVVFMLAVTYCAGTLSFFYENPTGIMWTKDPADNDRTFGLFWGLIKWDLANNRIMEISRGGVGFLMCYPLVFILSMVVTGEKLKR